jgi:hypothetical protein
MESVGIFRGLWFDQRRAHSLAFLDHAGVQCLRGACRCERARAKIHLVTTKGSTV